MKRFHFVLKEVLACLVFALVLYLFYRSFYVLVLLIPFFIVFRKYLKKEEDRKYKDTLGLQFKDALIAISAALRAGYSIENALRESYEETKMLYGPEAPICRELIIMIRRSDLGITAEDLFSECADRSGVEDIATFAEVFRIARRSGGDMVEIIQKTAADIAAKIDTRNEISVIITSKRFEQNIMNVVPMAIIVYVSLTSGGLLDALYGNVPGVLIMTACLGLYLFAFLLSRRIMNIRL